MSTTTLAPSLIPPARYRYLRSATSTALPPDAIEDPRAAAPVEHPAGWVPSAPGGLFSRRTVGWRALTVKDQGVDIECEWDAPVFVDRIVVDASVVDQVSRVRVLVPVDGRLRQVGQADLSSRTRDEFVLERDARLGIDVGHPVQRCVIRFETRLADLVLTGGLDVVGLATAPLGIFPSRATDQESSDGRGPVVADFVDATITHHDEAGAAVAEHLVARASEALGQSWAIESGLDTVAAPAARPMSGTMVIDLVSTGSVSPSMGDEGFVLEVSSDRIVVTGSRRGLRYGVECVLQQLIMDGAVQAGRFVEEPRHSFRGVHLPLPGPSQVDYFRRLIRWLVVPARYNAVIIEVAGGMEFIRHPEINETWRREHARAVAGERSMPGHFSMVAPGETLSQEETRALVAELKALDLDVIPEVQSLSHVQYLTLAHPEIAEIAGEVDNTAPVNLFEADQPDAKVPSCYCPSNPASYALIDDVVAEILDVFEPQTYVHLGHDEVYELGVCPTCSTKDAAQLFADDVNHLCALVAERGLRPMIWSDMLQPDAPYRAAAAIEQLPADLVMMDFIWYFNRERDIEPYLLGAGREVVFGNLYASHFPRWQARSAQQGIVGGQVSTWIALDDEAMAREGKYFDIAMVGVMLWSDRYHRHHRPSLAGRIATLLTDLRSRMTGATDLDTHDASAVLLDQRRSSSERSECVETNLLTGKPSDDPVVAALLSRVDGPLVVHEGVGRTSSYVLSAPLTVPHSEAVDTGAATVRIAVPAGVGEIHLVYALTRLVARTTWEPLVEVGRYRVQTGDGTELASQPITSGGTAGHLFTRYATPLPTSYYRHQGWTATYRADPVQIGQTDDGRDLCLYRTVLRLSEPLAAAAELLVEMDAEVGTALVLAAVVAR